MSTLEPEPAHPPAGTGPDRREEKLDEEEMESFPASDPHSDWAGGPSPRPS